MRASLLTGIGEFALRELPKPQIQHDHGILVRIRMVGVCGSDMHYYTSGRIGAAVVHFPFLIGHEAAGVVEATGAGVTRLQPGQRIAVDPALSCGRCDQCLAGRENTCRHLLFRGAPGQLPGCLCEYVVLDERQCFPVSDGLSFELAALSEPLAVALYAVERSRITAGAPAAVLGAGPIGLSLLHVLREREIGPLFVTDRIEARLDYARQLGPEWAGNPDRMDVEAEIGRFAPLQLDFVFECTGNPEAVQQGIRLLKPGGKLVIVGIPGEEEIILPIHELRRKEIDMINIRRQAGTTQKAIDLLESGAIRMDGMATHHFPLEETAAAFDLVGSYRDSVIKAMIAL